MSSLHDLILGSVALVLLLAPGWIIANKCHVPQPWLAGFLGSLVGLTSLVFLLQTTGLGLSSLALLTGWAQISLLVVVLSRGPSRTLPESVNYYESNGLRFFREHGLLLLPLLPALAVVCLRTLVNPLHGVDTSFRWNYLAELMHSQGSLNFYPPVSSADYALYNWPDGIPPLVSSAYAWIYAFNTSHPRMTTPFVVTQYVLLLAAVFALARRVHSARAGFFACALLAATPMATWATMMGQETGLLALSFVVMLLYLFEEAKTHSSTALVSAALAAAAAGLCREYGLAVAAFGILFLIAQKRGVRRTLLFAGIAALFILPWYARNAVRTGNPFFNMEVAGLFSTNVIHADLMRVYQTHFSIAGFWREAWMQLPGTCLAALGGAVAGIIIFRQRALALALGVVLFIGLWLAALPYTAAGYTYALRVLNPALALGAVLGGMALAKYVPGKTQLAGLALALTLWSTEAATRSLVLPLNPYRVPVSQWLEVNRSLRDYLSQPIYGEIARQTKSGRVIVLGPHSTLVKLGVSALPLWSPELTWLHDTPLSTAESIARLRAVGIRYVLLVKGDINEKYLLQFAFFRKLGSANVTPLLQSSDLVLFELK